MGIDARMLFTTKSKITDEELKLAAWDMCAVLGAAHFFTYGKRPVPLFRVNVYEQDGPDFVPDEGETIIEVSLVGRYYGIGYERGHLPTYLMVAEWLEHRFPGCVVYYGGDSSGVLAEPFDASARNALLKHYLTNGHAPYVGAFGSLGGGKIQPPRCKERCVEERGAHQYGFGDNYAAFHCAGCGKSFQTNDNGETWTTKGEE